MPLFHTQSLKPVSRRLVQPGHAAGSQWPVWLMAMTSGSASPGHCAQETALWPFMTPCTLSPWSCLRFHTYSGSLWVPAAEILGSTLFGTDAMWAELGFGVAPCSRPHSSLSPLGQPGCPGGGENKSALLSIMHRGQRRRNARNSPRSKRFAWL